MSTTNPVANQFPDCEATINPPDWWLNPSNFQFFQYFSWISPPFSLRKWVLGNPLHPRLGRSPVGPLGMDLGARALPSPQRGPARRARGGAQRSGASRDDDGCGDAPAGGNLSSYKR